ncbi:MAG: DinB family protein [Pseudomonadota bacterium]
MITADWARMMARYTQWQNGAIFGAANVLTDADRQMDRGAFFGSIETTLNHLLWGDRIWMSRFTGTGSPKQASITDSVREEPDWPALLFARARFDTEILGWAEGLDDATLRGDLTWYSGAAGREVTRPLALCVTHFFNHGTHHRGQVHGMLTAAGARTEDTDLFLMPTL